MTIPDEPTSTRPTNLRPGPAALLAFAVMGFTSTSLAADEMLQRGQWSGEFTPANFGDDIDATFCIQKSDADSPPWRVTMQLDLPPPGNEPVEFEFLETEEESLKFRIDLLKALRECAIESHHEDELTFKCTLVDSDSEVSDRLTMQRVEPQPDDVCLPEDSADSEEEAAASE